MNPKEAFDFLELSCTVTPDELRKQYRKLLLKHHPDKGGTKENFLKLSEANRIAKKVIIDLVNEAATQLTQLQQDVLKMLDKAITSYASNLKHYSSINKKNGMVLCRTETSTMKRNGGFQYFDSVAYSSANPHLQELLQNFSDHINTYIMKRNFSDFRSTCENTLQENKYDYSRPLLIEAYDVLVCVFRTFFRLFDYLITFTMQNEELMAKTATPFATSLVNRAHFFVYSTVKPSPSPQLQALHTAFETAIKQLAALTDEFQHPMDPLAIENAERARGNETNSVLN
jgi:hypothetical protein